MCATSPRKFQEVDYDYAPRSYGLVLLGYSLKPFGSREPLGQTAVRPDRQCQDVVVIEYPPALERASSQVPSILSPPDAQGAVQLRHRDQRCRDRRLALCRAGAFTCLQPADVKVLITRMEKSLARYIWTHTWRQQLWILVVVALSMIPYFMSFDLPKQIVNGPIQGEGFEQPGATQTFMNLEIRPAWLSAHVTLFSRDPARPRCSMLFALSGVFLLLVIINGLFKFYINTYKGRLGERMLRRIRFELVDRVLRFPPQHFKRVKGCRNRDHGEGRGRAARRLHRRRFRPAGAARRPGADGAGLHRGAEFLARRRSRSGSSAVQGIIIPRMRRRLIVLGRERQLTARELSGRVGEIVDGIGTIHVHDTSNYERADISARLGAHLQDPLRSLPVEVPGQVHQQLPRPGDAVPVLFDRRLSGAQGQSRHRPAGRRHRRLQGPARPAEGADRLGPGASGRAGQISAGRRAIQRRQPSSTRRSRRYAIEPVARSPSRSARSTCRSPTTAARGCSSGFRCKTKPGETVAHRRHARQAAANRLPKPSRG